MAKRWSITSLVALALLGCLFGTEVEAQGSTWQKPAQPASKGAPPPQAPQVRPRPQAPQVFQPSQYPGVPKVQPAPSPNLPQYPGAQNFQPAPSANLPQYPGAQNFQPAPSANLPQYPGAQNFKPAPSANMPQYPGAQNFKPAPSANMPQYPGAQNFQPAPSANLPQYPGAQKFQPAQYPHVFSDQKSAVPQQEQQVPAVQQTQSVFKPSVAKQAPVQSCDVEANVRVPCGGSDISAAACEAIHCCFDGRQCYFGKAVTLQCTKDAQFIVVVSRDATLPNIDLESISLLGEGQGCTHVDSNLDFAIYQFPVTACGSIVTEEPGVIIYENRMSSAFEVGVGHRGIITRDTHFELLFQCRYTGTSVETLVVEVLPLQDPPLPVAALGPIRVHLRLANGECDTKGCNEVDVAYNSFYTDADYPVTKVLRDPVYVEVQLIEKTDPNLVLTLGRCWATTSPNAHSLPQWDILIDGCPYRDDRYLSALVPVGPSSGLAFPSHYRRFLFKMFTFVDPSSMEPLKEQVYIHCSTAVCTAAAGHSCEPSCFRKKRDVNQRRGEPKVVVSVGPVIMTSTGQHSVQHKNPAENI